MTKIFRVVEELDDKRYAYNQRYDYDEDALEKSFKEGCEHGYRKAMRELEDYNERGGRTSQRVSYKEGFEEKMERLRKRFG